MRITKIYFAIPRNIPIEDVQEMCEGLEIGIACYIKIPSDNISVSANRDIENTKGYENYNYTARLIDEAEFIVVSAIHYYDNEIQEQIKTALGLGKKVLVVHEEDYELPFS